MIHSFWSVPSQQLLIELQSNPSGLSEAEALKRLVQSGKNTLKQRRTLSRCRTFTSQFRSPISVLLIIAALLSALVGDEADGLTILGILAVSGYLGYLQEYRANSAISALLERLESTTRVIRDGAVRDIPVSDLVAGDVVALSAGSKIPADCRIIESRDLFVGEAALTGESFPAEKGVGTCAENTPLAQRSNSLFLGTYVISGHCKAVIVNRAPESIYGEIATELLGPPPPTEFELGVQRFGYMLLEVALAMSIAVFAINITVRGAALETLLFTLALTVGMTPQLLPAIVTSTLARAARIMADKDTIVRRLNAIADIGGIDVLCTDKTGTLTEGIVTWEAALGVGGTPSERVALYAFLNAANESGFTNALDDAIRSRYHDRTTAYTKIDEIPYDFNRRRLSVLLSKDHETLLITKGAVAEVSQICSFAETEDGRRLPFGDVAEHIKAQFTSLSEQGYRCLAVAYRAAEPNHVLTHASETGLTFIGLLTFTDPLKPDALTSIQALQDVGVTCKIITGDNRYVASHVARQLGLVDETRILTGGEVDLLDAEGLCRRVDSIDVFAEIDPHGKERIILALKKRGFSVGYLGDGINDAGALYAADVGISVDTAGDVTKEASDMVLLKKDLRVLLAAVQEGRRAFANTLKYVFISTSANFGNMFSMAGASLFASFLPLLPKQILLLNVLSDLPAMAIAADVVDRDITARPLRWNSRVIARFMAIYGIISSVFDYLTFFILLHMHSSEAEFRTAWFFESLLSEVLALFVIRTRNRLWNSPISISLLVISIATTLTGLLLPVTPLATQLGFTSVSLPTLAVIGLILAGYVLTCECAKRYRPTRIGTVMQA